MSFRAGEVDVDWPSMFPDSMVAFALGFYDVAVQCSSLVDHGPQDVLIFAWVPEKHFLPWAQLLEPTGAMGSIKLCFFRLLPGEEVVPHTLHVNRCTCFTGEGRVLL